MADRRTLTALLERAAGIDERGVRLLDRAERAVFYSWSEVWDRAAAAAGRMVANGVATGDRVALIYPTSIDFVTAFFATVLAGAIPVPLYPPVRLYRLDDHIARTSRMIAAVGARLVLAEPRILRVLGSAIAAAGPGLGGRVLDDLPPAATNLRQTGADDVAMIQFSSGTTVDPKPVALSHRAVIAQVEALNSHWPDGDGIRHSGVSWLPLYHDMGLIGCLIAALERPGDMTLIPPELFLARPAVWLRAISRWRATISVAPNFAYGLCAEKITDAEIDGVDLSGWRIALCGAEPVVPRVLRRFIDRFEGHGLRPEALTPVYGLSEATLAVTFSDLDRPFVVTAFDRDELSRAGRARPARGGIELASVGRPIGGAEITVVGADGRSCPDGIIGRVRFRGPWLMDGYFGRPDATREVLRGGWLDTGDLGFIHRGELYLTGRSKDVLILRGRSHAPTEIEAVADEVDGVRNGCTVAVSYLPENADGEVLVLLVERAKDGGRGADETIVARCRTAVRRATGLELDRVVVLAPGTLPRTSSGKLRRQESLRRLRAGELAAPAASSPLRIATTALRGAFDLARANRGRHG